MSNLTDTKVIIMKPVGDCAATCIVRSNSGSGRIRLSFDARSIPYGPGIIAASASLESGEVYTAALSVRGRSASGELDLPEMPRELALAYMSAGGEDEPVFFLMWGRRMPGRMEARRVKALSGTPSKAQAAVKPTVEEPQAPPEIKEAVPDEAVSFAEKIPEPAMSTPEPEEEPEEVIYAFAPEPPAPPEEDSIEETSCEGPVLDEVEEGVQEPGEPILGEDEAFPEREESQPPEDACEAVPESAPSDEPFVLPDNLPPGNARDAAQIFHELAQHCPLVRPYQIQGTRFVRVDCPGVSWGSHYIVGMGAKNGLPTVFYIGVPGKYQLYPPPGLEGYRYMNGDDGQSGYWMKATSLE